METRMKQRENNGPGINNRQRPINKRMNESADQSVEWLMSR